MTEGNDTSSADQPTGSGVPTASDRPAAPPSPATPPRKPDSQAGRQPGMTSGGKVRHGRVSALYVGLIVAAILTIFLLVFIAQNSDSVAVKFLGFEGQISLAVALLLSAVIGVLVVAVPGSLRIVQLRRALRKNANT